ncbi:hypothetical protein ARMSODRAFT_980802 [Armillaria solidipes]|uniref:Uncharacterized protein n=1 Tax=Armillaria solidipes TaxID=1076256 RepID=A0A2H3AXU0_9AGAR|nr:hypothetical protein ARMSODRAFT_980802 [Armillaria solidipes]
MSQQGKVWDRSFKVSAADVLAELPGSLRPHHGGVISLWQKIRRTITSGDDGRRDITRKGASFFPAQHFAWFIGPTLAGSKSSDLVLGFFSSSPVTPSQKLAYGHNLDSTSQKLIHSVFVATSLILSLLVGLGGTPKRLHITRVFYSQMVAMSERSGYCLCLRQSLRSPKPFVLVPYMTVEETLCAQARNATASKTLITPTPNTTHTNPQVRGGF